MQDNLTLRQTKRQKAMLFAICLLVFIFIVVLVWPLLTGKNIGIVRIENATDMAELPEAFHMQFNVSVPANSESVEVELQSVEFPYNFPEGTCALFLSSNGTARFRQAGVTTDSIGYLTEKYGLTSVCKRKSGGVHLNESDDLIQNLNYGSLVNTYPIVTVRSTYFYPFDKQIIGVYVTLKHESSRLDTSSILKSGDPIITIDIDAPEWAATGNFRVHPPINETTQIPENTVQYTYATIELQRPLSHQILTGILLGSIFIFIVLLIFIDELGNFLEVAVGILLGLWGIQAILVPDYISGPTIVDTLILTLYVLFAFAIFIRFIIKPRWRKLTPLPIQDVEEQKEVVLNFPNPLPVTFSSDADLLPFSTDRNHKNHQGKILQWITAISSLVIAIATLLNLINRNKNQN